MGSWENNISNYKFTVFFISVLATWNLLICMEYDSDLSALVCRQEICTIALWVVTKLALHVVLDPYGGLNYWCDS